VTTLARVLHLQIADGLPYFAQGIRSGRRPVGDLAGLEELTQCC